jgi:hypothetical protein
MNRKYHCADKVPAAPWVMNFSHIDPLGFFFAFFIVTFGAMLWLTDHLTEVRRRNTREAMFMRVLGWGPWRRRWNNRRDQAWIDRIMRGGY